VRSLPWVYWELASGFGVYDPAAGRFRDDVLAALYGR
jgi:endoglucanase